MKVEKIRSTQKPEDLVARAARNDYRSEGIIGYSLEEILQDVSIDEEIKESAAGYREEYDDAEFNLDTEAKKRSLLKHLMNSGHWGPFEHVTATVSLEGVTRVLMGQVTRHREFTFDIMSLRYVNVEEDGLDRFQIPKGVKEGEFQSRKGVKELDNPERVENLYIESYENDIEKYRALIDEGVPAEEARKVLPMGTKVNITMSGNARAWMHILNVRTKANVQGETKRCAENIFQELKEWMPYTFERYDEKVLPLKLNP